MRNDHRQFFIYDLEIGAEKKGAQVPDMATVMSVWQKMTASGQTLSIRSKTATLLIGAIDVNATQRYATILVRLSDTKAPNSVYSDPSAGHYEEHVKTGNQGADLGCHVLVSLEPERGYPDLYTCAIEKVTGLSADLVQRLLSKLLTFEYRAGTFFTYPHPAGGLRRDGTPKTDRCCPHIKLLGRASDKLASDLENGQLTGVSLVQVYANTPVSGAPYLTAKRAELKLEIDRQTLPKANILDNLIQVFAANSKNYDSARISYKLPGGGRQVSVEVDSKTGAPLDELYVRSFEVSNIFPFLASSAKIIVPHLVTAAEQQFLSNRNL